MKNNGVEIELKFPLFEPPEEFLKRFTPSHNCDKADPILPCYGSAVKVHHQSLIDGSPRESVKNRNRSCCAGFTNPGKRIYQKTVMFDNDQSLMQKTNGRIRLRQNGETVNLSYKLPLPSDTVKKEIEWETKMDSWQIAENLLKAMGFSETTSYEKYRTSFEYKGVKLEIDEYPFANFLEIEGEEKKVKKVGIELGFDLVKALTKACDTLFTEWRAAKGLAMKPHMRFEDYDK